MNCTAKPKRDKAQGYAYAHDHDAHNLHSAGAGGGGRALITCLIVTGTTRDRSYLSDMQIHLGPGMRSE